jgi:hypothetical protein
MSFLHIIQTLTILLLVGKIFQIDVGIRLKKPFLILIVLGFALLYYLLVYNKEKWVGYVEEFKNENAEERRKGTFLVNLYTAGSIILFFLVGIVFYIILD